MRRCWFCVFETPSLIISLDMFTACICASSPDEVFIFSVESAGLSLDSICPSPVSPVSCNSFATLTCVDSTCQNQTINSGSLCQRASSGDSLGSRTSYNKTGFSFIFSHYSNVSSCPVNNKSGTDSNDREEEEDSVANSNVVAFS